MLRVIDSAFSDSSRLPATPLSRTTPLSVFTLIRVARTPSSLAKPTLTLVVITASSKKPGLSFSVADGIPRPWGAVARSRPGGSPGAVWAYPAAGTANAPAVTSIVSNFLLISVLQEK
jgi:hypothetical protein